MFKKMICFVLISSIFMNFAQASSAAKIILNIGSKEAIIDGQIRELDIAPYIDASSGRTLVPLRFVIENISKSYQIDWSGKGANEITLSANISAANSYNQETLNAKNTIVLKVGSNVARYSYESNNFWRTFKNRENVNIDTGFGVEKIKKEGEREDRLIFKKDYKIDQAPVIINGRTMVPLRLIANIMQYKNEQIVWSPKEKKVIIN